MFIPIKSISNIPSALQGCAIAGTGHRPEKLGGYSGATLKQLTQFAVDWLRVLAPRGVVSGMALGWDQALAHAAVELNLPFCACLPFVGQERRWPEKSQKIYRELLERAAKVIVCSPGGYSAQAMQVRNERMVDIVMKQTSASGLLLALWNYSPGGTKNCVDYARARKCPAINLWSSYGALIKN